MIYQGLLGHLSEAFDLKEQLGCTTDEALELQRELVAVRLGLDEPEVENNVIPFRRKP